MNTHRLTAAFLPRLAGSCLWLVAAGAVAGPVGDEKPIKVFVMAGQSNMQGQAVVDLSGKDYNEGKGTLAALFEDPVKKALVSHLKGADGAWRVRDDVFVRFQPSEDRGSPVKAGPLTFGFTGYEGLHHFGPELQFGHVMGEAFENEVLIIKTAWGGKSLYADYRPPSSVNDGGKPGPYYTLMIEQIKESLANLRRDFPKSKAVAAAGTAGPSYDIAGFVWYQGWNDGCDPKNAVPEYEANLVNLIRDVRKDLGVPKLPVVVGELTGPWVQATGEWDRLRKAQAQAAAAPEFAGSVVFVPTHEFVRLPKDSPNPGHGHHEFGNAETYVLVGEALAQGMAKLMRIKTTALPIPTAPIPTAPAPPAPASAPAKKPAAEQPSKPVPGEMAGYMLVPTERVPETFNAGFSLYAAAWPLVQRYPGHRFQTGLFGTWMFAQFPGQPPKDAYSDIEGGLGWWRDTRFPTETPKFIMGGVGVNFSEIANGPSHGAGTWEDPKGLYGVAQLSPWLLFPIDGLNLKQGTCGQLFGYGYLPLPLTNAKATTAGSNVPTGDHSWTLFLNTKNFKGPVCFFTPYFWSRSSVKRPDLAGLMLDSRPSDPNKAFQMETQYVPALIGSGTAGESFARVAPMWFPVGEDGNTVVLHRLTSYNKAALWDGAKAWFEGGPAPTVAGGATGIINPAGAFVQPFKDGGGSTWQIYADGTGEKKRTAIDWHSFASPIVTDPTTYGYSWKPEAVRRIEHAGGDRVTLPEYYTLDAQRKNPTWVVIPPGEVPGSAGLAAKKFDRPKEPPQDAYDTPEDPQSSFKKPGPVAGPFQVKLGDGSVVTYSWYRFADQPAMLNADLSPTEREQVQLKVEKMHREWTKDREYLAPPTVGTLADLDPAQIVKPPAGFEIGYVPIATRQDMPGTAKGKAKK